MDTIFRVNERAKGPLLVNTIIEQKRRAISRVYTVPGNYGSVIVYMCRCTNISSILKGVFAKNERGYWLTA